MKKNQVNQKVDLSTRNLSILFLIGWCKKISSIFLFIKVVFNPVWKDAKLLNFIYFLQVWIKNSVSNLQIYLKKFEIVVIHYYEYTNIFKNCLNAFMA